MAKIDNILDNYQELDNSRKAELKEDIACLIDQSITALIDYIENHAEIPIPIDEMFNEDGNHITKKEYGKVLLKHLVEELRCKFLNHG